MAQQSSGAGGPCWARSSCSSPAMALKYGIKPPIPSNLLYAYTIIIGIAIYVYLASNTARWESFSRPCRACSPPGKPASPAASFSSCYRSVWVGWCMHGAAARPVARRVAHHSPHAAWANHRAGQELQPHRPGKSLRKEPDKLAQYADEGRSSIFRIASLATATISMAPDISPTDSFHPQRISSTSAPLPNCRSHTSSGASPRAVLACHRNRIRGIQPCRFGRISSRKKRSGRSSCTSMLGLDNRRAPGKDTEP